MAATITTPPAPTKITRPDAETSDKTENEPPFNVVLLDDNDHTFAYVIEMLRAIFGYPAPKGHGMAREVHTTGRVIVETTHKELAELRQEQIHAYGPDHRISRCKGSMSAVIEPAEGR